MHAVLRRDRGACGERPALPPLAHRAPANAAPLRGSALAGRISIRLEGARVAASFLPTRGGTVGRRILSPHAQFAAPGLPLWGSAGGGAAQMEDLDNFPDPSAQGVPFARVIDLAEPEIWCDWVRACAEVRRAEARLADEKRRRAEDLALAAARGASVTVGSGMKDPVFAAGHHLSEAERRRDEAASAAKANAMARLRSGALRAFARPESGRAPWQSILPYEWKNRWRYDQDQRGAIDLGNILYWDLHLHDDAGLPPIQALVVYSRCEDARRKVALAPIADRMRADPLHDGQTLDLARTAIGRQLLDEAGGNADDATADEKNALEELGKELAARLHTGRLIAIRDDPALGADDFPPGASLADGARWEGDTSIRVRPPAPPTRAAALLAPDAGIKKQMESHRVEAVAQKGKGGRKQSFDRESFHQELRRLYRERPNLPPEQRSVHMIQWANANLRGSDGHPPTKQWTRKRIKEARWPPA